MINVKHIDHVAIAVKDVHASGAWYRETLGLERRHQEVWGDDPPVMMCAGDTCVALFPTEGAPAEPPGRGAATMRHLAFALDRANFEAAREAFEDRAIPYEFADHEICHSLYISDPDGHRIELTTYEIG